MIFELVRDPRGSLVHVRQRNNGECVGCIEAGLFEIVRSLILAQVMGDSALTVAWNK